MESTAQSDGPAKSGFRLKPILLGCGGGCLGLLVLSIAGCVGFTMWLQRPGELLEPERLIGREATGYLEWNLRLGDPGTEQLVDRLIAFTQQTPAEADIPLPPWLTRMLITQRNRQREQQMRGAFPMVAAWTQYTIEGQELHLGTLSVEKAGNRLVFWDWVVGMMLGWNRETAPERYRDEKIYVFGRRRDREPTVFLRGNDIFVTDNLDNAKRAVDLLALDPSVAREPTRLERLVDELPQELALRGAVTNDVGELSRLLELLLGSESTDSRDPMSGVRALTVSGGLTEDSSVEGVLGFRCTDASWARAHAAELITALRPHLEEAYVQLDADPRVEGDWVRTGFRINDLPGLLEQFADIRIQ